MPGPRRHKINDLTLDPNIGKFALKCLTHLSIQLGDRQGTLFGRFIKKELEKWCVQRFNYPSELLRLITINDIIAPIWLDAH
jgi:hypothetical protein